MCNLSFLFQLSLFSFADRSPDLARSGNVNRSVRCRYSRCIGSRAVDLPMRRVSAIAFVVFLLVFVAYHFVVVTRLQRAAGSPASVQSCTSADARVVTTPVATDRAAVIVENRFTHTLGTREVGDGS